MIDDAHRVVLVVDDDAGDRMILRRGLAGLPYDVEEAATLEEAASTLHSRADVCAVVVDLGLAGGHRWIDIISTLTEATTAPVIVCTGRADAAEPPLESMLIEAGAEEIVIKGGAVAFTAGVAAAIRRGLSRRRRDDAATIAHPRRIEALMREAVITLRGMEAPTVNVQAGAVAQAPGATSDQVVAAAVEQVGSVWKGRAVALGLLLSVVFSSCWEGLRRAGP